MFADTWSWCEHVSTTDVFSEDAGGMIRADSGTGKLGQTIKMYGSVLCASGFSLGGRASRMSASEFADNGVERADPPSRRG